MGPLLFSSACWRAAYSNRTNNQKHQRAKNADIKSELQVLPGLSPHPIPGPTPSPAGDNKSPGFYRNQKPPPICPSALPGPPSLGARSGSTSSTMEAPFQAQQYGRDDHTSILPFSLHANASVLQASFAQRFPALMAPRPHAPAPTAPVVILGGTVAVRVPLAMPVLPLTKY